MRATNRRMAAATLAAACCLGLIGTVKADDLSLQPDYATVNRPLYLQTEPSATPDTPPKPEKPLAGLLDKAGIKTGPFSVYGFVEGSYTYSFSNPPGDFITGRVFDIDNQELILNQADLSIEKTVDAAAAAKDNKWDLGGKVEVIYGNDARFVHANGLNFYGPGFPQLSPENQFDLVQAYVDVGIPVGNGLMIRAGRMVTHMGYETINPTTNPFYSHTYLFGYAIPFTHTGVMAFYNVNDKLSVMGGISRGWDQSTKDNNDSIDYLGQVKYVFNDKLTGYFNAITGTEQTDNDSNYRTVFDGILTCAASDKLSFALNADYGWEADAAAGGGTAVWYGAAAYAGLKLCDAATLNGRVEYFNDDDGARGIGGAVYEGTIGLAVKPFPHDDLGSNLVLRPELRFDYSDDGIFDGGTDNYQVTAAIDAIFTF